MIYETLITLALFTATAGHSLASPNTDVMVPVHQFVDSFNKGDATTSTAGCAYVTSILDDFPPHEWHGAGACAKWMASYKAFARENGIADMIIALGDPRHIDITTDHAYVVIPASYTLKDRGKLVKKTNSILTFALEKKMSGWCIVAWAWADG